MHDRPRDCAVVPMCASCHIDECVVRDLDDALSCEKLANGNFKVGVHIADVSYVPFTHSRLLPIIMYV